MSRTQASPLGCATVAMLAHRLAWRVIHRDAWCPCMHVLHCGRASPLERAEVLGLAERCDWGGGRGCCCRCCCCCCWRGARPDLAPPPAWKPRTLASGEDRPAKLAPVDMPCKGHGLQQIPTHIMQPVRLSAAHCVSCCPAFHNGTTYGARNSDTGATTTCATGTGRETRPILDQQEPVRRGNMARAHAPAGRACWGRWGARRCRC